MAGHSLAQLRRSARLAVSMVMALVWLGVWATARPAQATEYLDVFTWEGYVLEHEIAAVNALLKAGGYDIEVRLLDTWAEGPEQMFQVMRGRNVDISFLTLNYIEMEGLPFGNLLQPINTASPRLTNYDALSPDLTRLDMGMDGDKALYIPWGGGAYGIWANTDRVDMPPRSVRDLLEPRWAGRVSLTSGQVQPNVALALMAMGRPPFYINDMAHDRDTLQTLAAPNGELQRLMNALYAQVGHFWEAGPIFGDNLDLVASYGPGVAAHNARGGNWELVTFDEGRTVWLDTINFSHALTGDRLEAAEIFANYFIGKSVQERVANGLGMVAASTLPDSNPLIDADPNFFDPDMFWPPYSTLANNVMRAVALRAMP